MSPYPVHDPAGAAAAGEPGAGAGAHSERRHALRCASGISVQPCSNPRVCVERQVSPRLVGLALGQVLNLSGTMQWAVRQSAEAENNMTSIERLLEYTRLPQARTARCPRSGGCGPVV